MFGMPRKGEIDYSVDLELNLGDVQPGVAGPKRPQDRINLPELATTFRSLLQKPVKEGGYGKQNSRPRRRSISCSSMEVVRVTKKWLRLTKATRDSKPGAERNRVEMVANRPTPDPAHEFAEKRIRFITDKAELVTAAC